MESLQDMDHGPTAVFYFIINILLALHIYTGYQYTLINVIFWVMFCVLALVTLRIIAMLASGSARPAKPDGLTSLIVWITLGLVLYILYDQQYTFTFWASCVTLVIIETAAFTLKERSQYET